MPQKQPDHTQGQFHIKYILLTQSSATNQTHVELTVVDVDVGTLQYCLFPGEHEYGLIVIKFCSCCVKV